MVCEGEGRDERVKPIAIQDAIACETQCREPVQAELGREDAGATLVIEGAEKAEANKA